MSLFLDLVPVKEAVRVLQTCAPGLPAETVSLPEALGRILAAPVTAREDTPGFSRSVVDGYAVYAADTTGAGEAIPAMLAITGRIGMGEGDIPPLSRQECMYVPTGGILPPGADAVAMIEYSEEMGRDVLVRRAVAQGENVTLRGDDFHAGEGVFEPGRHLSPRDLGVLGGLGYGTVQVIRQPKVGIISTGNELVPVEQVPGPGEIRDVNTYLCYGYVCERGGRPEIFGIVPDEREALEDAVRRAARSCDLVLISGGSSKGERDMCGAIIEEMGTVHIHGIAIAPGKPTIIGTIGTTPVIGLPGHPASSYVVLIALVDELIGAMTGSAVDRRIRNATLTTNISSARGREDYVRVRLEGDDAVPLFGKSGLTNTLIYSTGLIRVPESREGLEKGEEVEVILW